ncbi:MAG: endonuclease/exonuclease/phosphatase [Planctomycetes bacterium]|nr:endonuclease/exonuclease/phosphatase [Planctomycetota bacterium]
MRKLLAVLAAAVVAGGAWLVSLKYEIRGWSDVSLAPRDAAPAEPATSPVSRIERATDTIRIAAFHIDSFDEAKAERPHVMARLADILGRYDVAAIQDIRSRNQDLLPRLVELLNAEERQYDYVIGPRLGRSRAVQCAFVFDAASVEIDRSEAYVVNDPHDLLSREPLVAWFRVRGPAPEAAFTFTLVNVHVDPPAAEQEVDELAQVFRAVQHDGREEDDVILLGSFHVDDRYVGRLNDVPELIWAVSGVPTTTRGDAQRDNLVFSTRSTNEFTGRMGVFDFLREFNLTLDDALEISDHLPVWAEFSIYEGGRPGRVAVGAERL